MAGSRSAAGNSRLIATKVPIICTAGGAALIERSGPHWLTSPLNAVTFTMTSPDGEQGFPGTVHISTTYRLTDDNVLAIRMRGSTDAPTLLNAVHHTYWNLAGQGAGDVRSQELQLFSDFYTPIDNELITTGEVLSVAGTAFDFRSTKPIGRDIDTLRMWEPGTWWVAAMITTGA